jgi:hypothetical protein
MFGNPQISAKAMRFLANDTIDEYFIQQKTGKILNFWKKAEKYI